MKFEEALDKTIDGLLGLALVAVEKVEEFLDNLDKND